MYVCTQVNEVSATSDPATPEPNRVLASWNVCIQHDVVQDCMAHNSNTQSSKCLRLVYMHK